MPYFGDVVSLKKLNLKSYPQIKLNKKYKKVTVTIGDLHANVMLLLHYLLILDIINMPQDKYEELALLYYSHEHYLDKTPIMGFTA